MASRAHVALLLSGLLALAAIAVGLDLVIARGCDLGGCAERAVGLVIGIPVVLLGAGQLTAAAIGWQRGPGAVAQGSCAVWAAVLLLAGAAIGGAASIVGILLAVTAVAAGALSVWVPR